MKKTKAKTKKADPDDEYEAACGCVLECNDEKGSVRRWSVIERCKKHPAPVLPRHIFSDEFLLLTTPEQHMMFPGARKMKYCECLVQLNSDKVWNLVAKCVMHTSATEAAVISHNLAMKEMVVAVDTEDKEKQKEKVSESREEQKRLKEYRKFMNSLPK